MTEFRRQLEAVGCQRGGIVDFIGQRELLGRDVPIRDAQRRLGEARAAFEELIEPLQ